ncbi:hypothetical protein BDK89_4207 [Ilumatobacter fluminis]|uniref:FHA domain-containing protein n=2 Tax=Ilumatobacter fluminis TaxID=467091 RepID=A0A4R7I6Z4_9ACTN|nr:hypothetical protein BDK89_4207 [Ilumatobacter fluminis]
MTVMSPTDTTPSATPDVTDGDTNATHTGDGATSLLVEFCGEVVAVDRTPFTIGRDADYVIDDENRFLHRHFVRLDQHGPVWVLHNVGDQLSATVSDTDGLLEAFLAPGAALPLVFERTVVRFTAGPTTYEFTIRMADAAFQSVRVDETPGGDTTIGRVAMTPDQLRLVLALAEPNLQGGGRPGTAMPSSAQAAERLGWTTTKFNRKLDNVCQKLTAQGVRGLHGEPGRLASNRRARLVEYALAMRLVTRDDLHLLDQDEG